MRVCEHARATVLENRRAQKEKKKRTNVKKKKSVCVCARALECVCESVCVQAEVFSGRLESGWGWGGGFVWMGAVDGVMVRFLSVADALQFHSLQQQVTHVGICAALIEENDLE